MEEQRDFLKRILECYPLHEHEAHVELFTTLKKWVETRDSDHLDNAIMCAREHQIHIKGVFLDEVANEAGLRFFRDGKARKKIRTNNTSYHEKLMTGIYENVFKLNYFAGFSVDMSCALESLRLRRENHIIQIAWSTLSKRFPEWKRKHKDRLNVICKAQDTWCEARIVQYLDDNNYDLSDPFLNHLDGRH